MLAKGAGQIVSRESCCLSLRGIDYDFTDRSIDMRIATLRKKLSLHANQQPLIKTVRNKGYILIDQ
ncbi:MAG: winged helix-turn-helix domain-containing protein [Gammaproteobacteria bacterium]|nr:winged helix-turn-helix domain-containing protein [Gammaproteobacteria bacterium]